MENSSNEDNEEEQQFHGSIVTEWPHEALFLVLAYLPLFELLSVGKACKSLRDAVNNDTLLWLHIKVERPLSFRLSDDALMRIASKANGRITTLSLINCVNITDDGIQRLVHANPLIEKLHLPQCTALTPAGVIRAVQTLKKHNNHKQISLRINGIYDIQKQHLEILHSIISSTNITPHQPIFYHEPEKSCLPLDVALCPLCDQVRMVFHCPTVSCGNKPQMGLRECKACYYCIPRCNECGKCVEIEEEPVEAACEDSLCLDCWLKLPKCSFCNRPYCSKHTDLRHRLSEGSAEFLCDYCHMKSSD